MNTRMYGGMLDFLHKNEDHFTDWDRTRLQGLSMDDAQHVQRDAAPACCINTPRRTE